MAFRILGIDHVVIRARELERMVAFYRDVVGCTVDRRQDAIGLVQMRAGRSLIDLVDALGPLGATRGAPPGREGANMDHLCLRVDPFDRDAIASHLRAHGVAPGEYGRRYGAEGEGPSLYFDDLEGNMIELKGPPDSA